MPYKRKKGGQRLMELAKESRRKANERKRLATNRANRLISGASPKITYKPTPSPHLKPKSEKPKAKPDIKPAEKPVAKQPVKKPTPKPVAKTTEKPLTMAQKVAKYGGVKAVSKPKATYTRAMDRLFPKHRGIGQSQTGYSRAGAGDVGLEMGKKALNAWLSSSGTKAVWSGAKQLKHAPGLAKKMKPWLTGKKPVMSKEFVKTLGGKSLADFVKFTKKHGRRLQERLGLKPIPKPRRITHKPDFIKPTGPVRPTGTTAKPKPKPPKSEPPKWQSAADKPITKPPTGKPAKKSAEKKLTPADLKKMSHKEKMAAIPRFIKESGKKPVAKKSAKKPAKKPVVKKAPAKKPTTPKQTTQTALEIITSLPVGAKKLPDGRKISDLLKVFKKPAAKKVAKKKTTPKQAMQSLIDEVSGLRVGKGKPRIVPKKKPAAKKPAKKGKKKS